MASKPVCLAGLIVLSLGVTLCRAAEPWDAPFTKDTAAVLQAAGAVKTPKNAGVVVLLDERVYSIDRAGRTVSTIRKVYRVVTQDAIEDWASLEQEYAPWHERQPELRARVISPDGAAHWLDGKTITEAPARQFDASVFSDNRVLRAPLPAVTAGAVVEWELTVRETAATLEAGEVRRIAADQSVETERLHIVVDAAQGIGLQKLARLIPPERIHEAESRKGRHIEIDMGPLAAREEWEWSVPFDVATGPVFEFSTGRSWQAVAGEYEGIVNRQIANADLRSLIQAAPAGEDRIATVTRLATLLHQKVRYTGVEFGEAAIVPRAPAETLTRGYGDCKDKAALLVALLRAVGFEASVALLDPGAALDVAPELPGFGLFSHAVVYVEGPKPLWIDATASSVRVGDLPTGDQGRLALIVRASTTGLAKTPESQSSDNRAVHEIVVRLSEDGRGNLVETSEGTGSYESQIREMYGDPARLKETLERQMKGGYKAEALGDYSATGKDDFSRPFRVSVEALKTPLGYTADDEAVAIVVPGVVFQDLDFALRANSSALDGEEKKKRREDFVFTNPHQAEFRWRIVPPELFHSKSLPASESVKAGSLTYSRSFRLLEDGAVEADFRLDTGKRRLTASEFEAAREGLKPLLQEGPEILGFVSAPEEALALGNTKEAVNLVASAVKKHPESAGSQARLVRALIAAGDGDSAREAGRKTVALDGKSGVAWQALAWADEHDSFGRPFAGNWDGGEAEKSLRKAVELDPDGVTSLKLADLLERNAAGGRYGAGARMAEAIELYKTVQKKSPDATVQQQLVHDLLFERRLAEAEQETRKLADSTVKQEFTLAIVCLRDGAAQAIIDSQSSYPDAAQRASVLLETARTLFELRRYDRAAELAKASLRLNDSPLARSFAEVAGKIKSREEEVYPPSDPRHPVRRLLVAALSDKPDLEAVRKLFAENARGAAERVVAGIQRRSVTLRGQFERMGVSSEVIADALSGATELQKDGDDPGGYKVSAPFNGLGALPLTAFVVKESGEYRILATEDELAPLGQLVLDLLKAKDLKSAQAWLDRVVSAPVEVQLRRSGSRVAHPAAVHNLWAGAIEEARNAEAARIAAATLVAQFAATGSAIDELKEGDRTAANRVDRGNIELALCDAYQQTRRWPEMLATARQLEGNNTVSPFAFRYVVEARSALKQWKELEQDALARLKTASGDEEALRAAALAAMAGGDRAKATGYLRTLMTQEWAGADSRVLNGWNALLGGGPAEEALKRLADRVGDDQPDPGYYYVSGLLEASAGKAEEAQLDYSQHVSGRLRRDPDIRRTHPKAGADAAWPMGWRKTLSRPSTRGHGCCWARSRSCMGFRTARARPTRRRAPRGGWTRRPTGRWL